MNNILIRNAEARANAGHAVSSSRLPVLQLAHTKKKKKKKGKIAKVMREFKHGKLRSGSKKGPQVTNRKQAIAIAISEAKKAGQYKLSFDESKHSRVKSGEHGGEFTSVGVHGQTGNAVVKEDRTGKYHEYDHTTGKLHELTGRHGKRTGKFRSGDEHWDVKDKKKKSKASPENVAKAKKILSESKIEAKKELAGKSLAEVANGGKPKPSLAKSIFRIAASIGMILLAAKASKGTFVGRSRYR